jgi:hypothetical protein
VTLVARDEERDGENFHYPEAVTVHSDGTIYVADSENNIIKKITME